jgi:hypothetical protein
VHAVFVSYQYPFELDPQSSNPYTLSLVSRYWRDVVYSTPQLWVVLPARHPQLWDRISARSGALPLYVQWNNEAPELYRGWIRALKVTNGSSILDRLQGLWLNGCGRELKGLVRPIAPNSPLRHLHMVGVDLAGSTIWDGHKEFLTFLRDLPQLNYLGLGGNCIPPGPLTSAAPASQTRFEHPNLRHLWLKGRMQGVFRLLEFTPLQTLDSLEIHARIGNISEIASQNHQRIFQHFFEGRDKAARSLTLSSSSSVPEITINHPDHETECSANTPLFKFAVTKSNGTPPVAWKTLVGTLPLAGIEVLVLHNVRLRSSDVEHLLQFVPQTERIVVTGSGTESVSRALQIQEVIVPGE